jgi:hypothetical protein
LSYFTVALDVDRTVGRLPEQVATYKTIGTLLLDHLHRAEEAQAKLAVAVELQQRLGDTSREYADTLGWYGSALVAAGRSSDARAAFTEAAVVFGEAGDAAMAAFARQQTASV